MTTSSFAQLPLMAGSAMLAQLSRVGQWGFARYMRAPASSTAVLAMVTLTAMAGSNALFFQTAEHPSPFFAANRAVPVSVSAVAEEPPMPAPIAQREQAQDIAALPAIVPSAPATTGSVTPAQPQTIPDQPVGNADVFAVQKKLAELQFFSGTVDGYYGPMTARAIRAFEERNGLTPMGALEPGVVRAILSADSAGRIATPAAQPAPVIQQPAPAPQPQAAAEPVQAQPAAAAPQADQVVARLPPLSPAEQTFDAVASSAASTIDGILAGVGDNRGTASRAVANPPVPTASVQTPAPQTAPAQPVAAARPAVVAEPQPVVEASAAPRAAAVPPATDRQLVSQIQQGLASLGFFRGPVDGNPGPETARAIREFENFHRYRITGQVQPDLVGLLRTAGATI